MRVKIAQTAIRLTRLARRPVFVLLMVTLVVLGSMAAYAVVTHRNPFCFPLTAHGLLVQMTVAELTKASDTILTGTVAQVGPSWQATNGWVFTPITVNASEFLKSPTSQEVVQLRIDGGFTTCGGLVVEDQPSFSKGQSVLLFLGITSYNSADSYLYVVGGPQGKYTIENGIAWSGYPSNAVPLGDLIAEINRNL